MEGARAAEENTGPYWKRHDGVSVRLVANTVKKVFTIFTEGDSDAILKFWRNGLSYGVVMSLFSHRQ